MLSVRVWLTLWIDRALGCCSLWILLLLFLVLLVAHALLWSLIDNLMVLLSLGHRSGIDVVFALHLLLLLSTVDIWLWIVRSLVDVLLFALLLSLVWTRLWWALIHIRLLSVRSRLSGGLILGLLVRLVRSYQLHAHAQRNQNKTRLCSHCFEMFCLSIFRRCCFLSRIILKTLFCESTAFIVNFVFKS